MAKFKIRQNSIPVSARTQRHAFHLLKMCLDSTAMCVSTHMCLWQTEQTQSVERTLYSRQALQTLSRQARQKAPLFMMRPSSARQRAQDRTPGLDSSGPQPDPERRAPLRLRACNSAFSLLKNTKNINFNDKYFTFLSRSNFQISGKKSYYQ